MCFNSKLVRLKVSAAKTEKVNVYRFNSKLVRLKDANRTSDFQQRGEFQFQTGSIKSRVCTDRSHCRSHVSIPNWFD